MKKEDIIKQIRISGDIKKELENQAALYAYWAFQCATAREAVRKGEERYDRMFSRLYGEYRQKHRDAKENDCKSYIRQHTDYRQCGQDLQKAKYQADLYESATKAFDMRARMLQQLSAMTRDERETSMLSGSTIRHTREAMSRKASRVATKIAGKRKGENQ